jgi:Leucine rich repeat
MLSLSLLLLAAQELASLVMLTRLVLDSNRLQQLPPPVLVLPRLAVLMVSQNTLTTIPEGISSLRSTLRILTVHSNSLSLLPDTMSCLTRLRVLGASGNRLWCLPTGLCSGCCALRILDCSHNVLDGLPQGMQQLSRLRSLKVNHNRLGWLPTDELAGLPRLAELDVTGNAVAAEVGVDTHAHSSEAVACLLRAVAAAPQEGSSNPQHQPSGQRSTSQPSHNTGVAGALLLTSGISGASPNSDMLPPPLPPLPPAIKHGRPLQQQQHAQASRACTASSSSNQRRSVNWTVPEEDGGGCESTDHVQETRGDVGCSNSDSGDNGDGNNTHNLHVDTMTALPSVACSLHDAAEIISPVQPAATKHSASTGKAAGLCVALEMPCVVLALLRAPPPPQSADAAVPARPQTRARLHRVLEQTARALELLEGSGGPKQGHSEHLTGPSTTT